jgi:hypothetical protein
LLPGAQSARQGMLLGNHLKGMASRDNYAGENVPSAKVKYDQMKDIMKYRKIDTYAHIYFTDDSPGFQLDFGERLGIDKQVISRSS